MPGEGGSTVAVMADAQFGVAHVLKPFLNFEPAYQGLNAVNVFGNQSVPVAMFGEVTRAGGGRDAMAGKPGFDPNLLGYCNCPMGSLIKLWIPLFSAPNALNVQSYRYIIHWRLTDIARLRKDVEAGVQTSQYHLPRESPGAPDTVVVPSQPRFVIPSATRAILLGQPEVAGVFTGQPTNVRREYLIMRTGEPPGPPLVTNPAGSGVYQQGVIDPSVDPSFAGQSAFSEIELITGGDRMMITVDRFGIDGVASGADPWDFQVGGNDEGFANIYGTNAIADPHPDFDEVGIYVLFGTAP